MTVLTGQKDLKIQDGEDVDVLRSSDRVSQMLEMRYAIFSDTSDIIIRKSSSSVDIQTGWT